MYIVTCANTSIIVGVIYQGINTLKSRLARIGIVVGVVDQGIDTLKSILARIGIHTNKH